MAVGWWVEKTAAVSGITTGEAFGAVSVGLQLTIIYPSGAVSQEAFGGSATNPGAVTITATGAATAEAFGLAELAESLTIRPTGVSSTEAFGTAAATFTLPYTVPFTI